MMATTAACRQFLAWARRAQTSARDRGGRGAHSRARRRRGALRTRFSGVPLRIPVYGQLLGAFHVTRWRGAGRGARAPTRFVPGVTGVLSMVLLRLPPYNSAVHGVWTCPGAGRWRLRRRAGGGRRGGVR
eukprot:IDg21244t1